MKLKILKMVVAGAVLLFGGIAEAKGGTDYTAGYHDGCQSSRGHYSRSRYKYTHSTGYHRGWLRGRRSCVSGKKALKHTQKHRKTVHHRRPVLQNTGSCNTAVPWEAFRKGWSDGLSSAKGRMRIDRNGCEAYRRGWISGYRSCHCGKLRKRSSYSAGYHQGCSSSYAAKIRDDYYYRTVSGYRHGWVQGYSDCRGIYK